MNANRFIINQLLTFRRSFYVCITGISMYPTLKNGERLIVYPYPSIIQTLNVGDIIVYNKFHDHLTAHRILNITYIDDTTFFCTTKGDNNNRLDSYQVYNHEILGVIRMNN